MYKIKEKHKNFNKPIRLTWLNQVTETKIKWSPAHGHHGQSGTINYENKAFGNLEYAECWLNETLPNPPPDFVSVNNVRSALNYWFEIESN